MKYFKSFPIFLAGAMLLPGCQNPSLPDAVLSATVRSANVVFINAAPDGPASESFQVNNAQSAAVTFPGGSQPTPITASVEQFRVSKAVFGIAGSDTISQSADLVSYSSASTIQGNGHYSIILTDTVNRHFGKAPGSSYSKDPGGLTFTTVTDAIIAPASGNSGIRFFNLAPGAPAVYLTHDNGLIFAGLTSSAAYKKTSGTFTSAPIGTYSIEVRTGSATGSIIATLTNTALADGKLYTIFLSGKVVSSKIKVPYAVSIVGHN
jgi:hypothetical protein